MSSKGLPSLGTLFSQILSLSVSCYNLPLIKFKVTLKMLTPKVKKSTAMYTHSQQVRENDINDLTPQNEKTTFYFKHKVQVLAFDNNNLK